MAEEIKTYKAFLRELFPQYERVKKVALNAGFSCPNTGGISNGAAMSSAAGISHAAGGCAYCNNSSFSAVAATELTVMEQLEAGIKRIKKGCGVLAYFQSKTNTYAPAQKLREVFAPVINHNGVAGIAIGTRPDCLPPDVVQLLAELNALKPVIVEIGVQTANDKTLANINRNHTAQCVRTAALLCKNAGLVITAHIIIGLPAEGMEDFTNTAKLIKECGFAAVKIHPLHIVKGTRFEEEYKRGAIKLLTLDEYCAAAAEVIRIVSPDMAIERVSGDSLNDTLIAPPWSGNREAIWHRLRRGLT